MGNRWFLQSPELITQPILWNSIHMHRGRRELERAEDQWNVNMGVVVNGKERLGC